MGELLDALASDFRGYEDIERLCKQAPKYGNDYPIVDQIAGDIFTFFADEIEKYYSKFAQFFATKSFVVYTFDYHGIGNSGTPTSALKKNTITP